MRQPVRFIHIVLFLLFTTQGAGLCQLSLFRNFKSIPSSQPQIKYHTDTSAIQSIERYKEIEPKLKPWQGERFPLNKTNQMLWLVIDLDKIPVEWKTRFLVIRNPHINYVNAWLLHQDSFVMAYPATGDKMPFATRQVNHADFSFEWPPLENPAGYTWVIAIDKRYETIHVPVHFFSQEAFQDLVRSRGILFGLMLGLMIFIMLFSLFLFINMREWLYIFYGLFILFSLYYQFGDAGYAFMYLFPNQPFFTDFSRTISASFSTLFYILFILRLLDTKKHLPRLYNISKWLIAGFLLFHVIAIPLLPFATSARSLLHIIWTIIGLSIILACCMVAIQSYRKSVPYSGYAIISILILLISSVIYSLFNSASIPDTSFTRNAYFAGIAFDIIILSLMLSLRFKRYKDEAEKGQLMAQKQQEAIFNAVTDYRQKELERLSQLLHDTVGARLSAIRLNLEHASKQTDQSESLEQSIIQVGNLADMVRNLSHTLSPVMLQQNKLQVLVSDYIKFINQSGHLRIQLDWMGDEDITTYRYKLMTYSMVQELLQNIIKHAQATEAIIQIICSDEVISIFVEDNGQGYYPDSNRKGLGLFQIEKLLHLTNGRFEVTNKSSGGTAVSIEFPVAGNL
jgi:signal transduction histidine kinase